MKRVVNHSARQQIVIVESCTCTRVVKRCPHGSQEGLLTLRVGGENELRIHLGETFVSSEVAVTALGFFSAPTFALETF